MTYVCIGLLAVVFVPFAIAYTDDVHFLSTGEHSPLGAWLLKRFGKCSDERLTRVTNEANKAQLLNTMRAAKSKAER